MEPELRGSPLLYLIGALYLGILASGFVAAVNLLPTGLLDRIAFVAFLLIAYLNATSLALFYHYVVSPMEEREREYLLTAAAAFLYTVVFVLCFLILKPRVLTYSVGLIGMGFVYAIAVAKYGIIFRRLQERVRDKRKRQKTARGTDANIERYLRVYDFYAVLKDCSRQTLLASFACTLGGSLLAIGFTVWGDTRSWVLSLVFAGFGFWLLIQILYHFSKYLNPRALEEFHQSRRKFDS
jgi:hypothetical protein